MLDCANFDCPDPRVQHHTVRRPLSISRSLTDRFTDSAVLGAGEPFSLTPVWLGSHSGSQLDMLPSSRKIHRLFLPTLNRALPSLVLAWHRGPQDAVPHIPCFCSLAIADKSSLHGEIRSRSSVVSLLARQTSPQQSPCKFVPNFRSFPLFECPSFSLDPLSTWADMQVQTPPFHTGPYRAVSRARKGDALRCCSKRASVFALRPNVFPA